MLDQPMQMEAHTGQREGEFIVRLRGPLTLGNIFEFQKTVRGDQSPFLVVDLTEVPYIDSAGIGALVGVHVSRQKDSRRLALVGVNERVRTALRITGVEQHFAMFSTQEEAEAAVS
jgi:anti-sigma B factor antagonist